MADIEHVLLERCINERYDGGTSCLIWKMDEAAPLLNEGSRTTFVLYTWKRGSSSLNSLSSLVETESTVFCLENVNGHVVHGMHKLIR